MTASFHTEKRTIWQKLKRVRTVFGSLYGEYRGSIAVLVALGAFGGLLESFGVSILVPLFSHVIDKPIEGANILTNFFDWFFATLGLEQKLRILLPLIVFVFILRGIVLYTFEWIRGEIALSYERATRERLYADIVRAPWAYLVRQKVGFAENTLMVDVDKSTRLLSDITNSTLHLSSLTIYVVLAFVIEPTVTAATFFAGAALLFVFRPFTRRVKEYVGRTVRINKSIAHDVNESVIGMKTIKALGAEEHLLGRTAEFFRQLKDVKLKQILAKSSTLLTIEPVSVIFVLGVFVAVFLQGDFNIALFFVLIFLIQRIFVYVDRVQNMFLKIAEGLPHAEYIVAVKRELEEVHANGLTGTKEFSFSSNIEFRDVEFSYQGSGVTLERVSLSIPKGGFVALVGASGSGKTTLVDLLLRLLSPTSGSITIDGVSIDDIALARWRSAVGYMAQEAFLLNGSIKDNIKFYDPSVTDADIEDAIERAHLTPLINKLPDKASSRVGERGVELSGGERQRIALARVLARKPTILILDEATSALDKESEHVIHEALKNLRNEMTIIVIAHRRETVEMADTVFVLDKGHIAESGTPNELIEKEGSRFNDLLN